MVREPARGLGFSDSDSLGTPRRAAAETPVDAMEGEAPGRRAQGWSDATESAPGRRAAAGPAPEHAHDEPADESTQTAPGRRFADDPAESFDDAPAAGATGLAESDVEGPGREALEDTAINPIVVEEAIHSAGDEGAEGDEPEGDDSEDASDPDDGSEDASDPDDGSEDASDPDDGPEDASDPDDEDELAPRRRAEGPPPPYVPARRNLRLVVGLIALVAAVTLPLVIAGQSSNDHISANAAAPPVPQHAAEVADLPAPEPVPAQQLDPVPGPVPGIAQPCPMEFEWREDAALADNVGRMQQHWGISLVGPEWTDAAHTDAVRLFATTLDAVDCTSYLDKVKNGNGGSLTVSSSPPRTSWAWGDYGLTRPHTVTLDMAKFQTGYAEGQRGRLVRLIIHEFAHVMNTDRFENPPYWQRANDLFNRLGPISSYGSTPDETFADAVGYYVARCAADNPYDDPAKQAYYDFVRDDVFGGTEFGTAVGEKQVCSGEEG